MQKFLRFVSTTALAIVLGAQMSLAQTNEALAGVPEEGALTEMATPAPQVAAKTAPEVPKVAAKPAKAAVGKKVERVNRLLNSRIGKWAVKRIAAKAAQKAFKKAKSKIQPDKTDGTNALSGKLRIALILGIIGIILTLLNNPTLSFIGLVLIIIALVLVLLELI